MVRCGTCLHSHYPIIHQHIFGEIVGADSCLVACAIFLVDLLLQLSNNNIPARAIIKTSQIRTNILVHQTSLAHAAISKDNDLELQKTLALVDKMLWVELFVMVANFQQNLLPC